MTEGVHDRPAPTIVVFDVGEVLIDETRVWGVWAEILGVSPLSFGAVLGAAIVQGLDYPDVFAEIAPNIDWHAFTEEHERRYGGFRDQDLYPDVRACLQELHDAGVVVVIAGNQPARRTAQLRALSLPTTLIATSDDIGAEKPDPAFFDGIMRVAGTADPAAILYVGDRIDNDMGPAAAHGMRTCWLRRGPWGMLQDFMESPEVSDTSRDDYDPALAPDLVLEGLGELPTLVQDWINQPPPAMG